MVKAWRVSFITMALIMYPMSGPAQQSNFATDIADQSIIVLTPNHMVPVKVTYMGDDKSVKQVRVLLSRFNSDQSDSVPVDILPACKDDGAPSNGSFNLEAGKFASFCLKFGDLTGDAKYTGVLSLYPEDKPPETRRSFSVKNAVPLPSILSTDRPAGTLDMSIPFWRWHAGSPMLLGAVALQEKSGKSQGTGIAVQTEPTLKGPIDPVTGLSLAWNGEEWKNPFSNTIEKAKTLAAGSQAQIKVYGLDLKPGEYIVPLRFVANGANTDNAKFALTVHVRDSVVWAILALLLALVLSLVVTKVLTGLRGRISMQQRIDALRVSKGTMLPKLPAVVWVDAVLSLAERLNSDYWLTGANVITDHVNTVVSTANLLRQARDKRKHLQDSMSPLIFQRAAQEMDRVLLELGPETPDDALAARIKSELDGFDKLLLQDTTFAASFWPMIVPAMQRLKAEIEAATVPADVLTVITPLKNILDGNLAAPPTDRRGVEESYANYARLRILWDCKAEAQTFALLTAVPSPELSECFRMNDAIAWKRLKDNRAALKIVMPPSDSTGIEAFAPVEFSVISDDPKVTNSFLFHRKIQFAWKLILQPAKGSRRDKAADVVLTPVTIGPSVVQYFPAPGQTRISVTLNYDGESIMIDEAPGPNVVKSTDFGILNAFQLVEYVSWAIAGIVALATGLSTYYFKSPTFGSFQDYLTLMLWGIGMDQGKNFLQALQQVSPTGSQTNKQP